MPEFGTFEDMRDGYEYRTVKIGKQIWLAENFRFDCAGSMVYENEKKNLKRYGRLYDWRTAINIAPEGWRLPSKYDWYELTKRVGGEDVEGKALKSREGWNREGNGTDEFGFGALPGGYGYSDCTFFYAGDRGYWWIAGEDDTYVAYSRGMFHEREDVEQINGFKSSFRSVRLLRR